MSDKTPNPNTTKLTPAEIAAMDNARRFAEGTQATIDPPTMLTVLGVLATSIGIAREVIHRLDERTDLLEATKAQLAKREKELELARMQLAACSVAAGANTHGSAMRARQMSPEYRCAAVKDVEQAVDREMKAREACDELSPLLGEAIRTIQGMWPPGDESVGIPEYKPVTLHESLEFVERAQGTVAKLITDGKLSPKHKVF